MSHAVVPVFGVLTSFNLRALWGQRPDILMTSLLEKSLTEKYYSQLVNKPQLLASVIVIILQDIYKYSRHIL